MKHLILAPIVLFCAVSFAKDRACSVIVFNESMTATAAQGGAFSDAPGANLTLDTQDGFITRFKRVTIEGIPYIDVSIKTGKAASSSLFPNDANHPFHSLTIDGISAQAQCPTN